MRPIEIVKDILVFPFLAVAFFGLMIIGAMVATYEWAMEERE